jgi:hypothetical protein
VPISEVLLPGWWEEPWRAIGNLVFVAVSLGFLVSDPAAIIPWITLAIFGVSMAIDIWMRATRARRRLELGPDAFRLFLHGRPFACPWSDVERFDLIRVGRKVLVGWHWTETAAVKRGDTPDPEAPEVLPSTYGLTPETLLAKLQAYGQGAKTQTQ